MLKKAALAEGVEEDRHREWSQVVSKRDVQTPLTSGQPSSSRGKITASSHFDNSSMGKKEKAVTSSSKVSTTLLVPERICRQGFVDTLSELQRFLERFSLMNVP